MGPNGLRSYNVKVGDQEYRRNRRQLIQTKEPPPLPDIQSTPESSDDTQESTLTESVENETPTEQRSKPRCSSRIRKKPDWFSEHLGSAKD